MSSRFKKNDLTMDHSTSRYVRFIRPTAMPRAEYSARVSPLDGADSSQVTERLGTSSRGREEPYLGTRTKEKRSEHGYKIVGSTPPIAHIRKLQTILSQSGGNPDFAALIDCVAATRGPITLSAVSSLLTQVVGGTIGHRYAARLGSRAAHFMGPGAFLTHCVVDSDNAGYVSGGEQDYPLMFQECFLFLLQILNYRSRREPSRMLDVVTLGVAERQMDEMVDETLVYPRGAPIPEYTATENILIRASTVRLERTSGPATSIACDPLQPDMALSPGVLVGAIDAFFRRQLTGERGARMWADHASGIATEKMDLLEAVGAGLDVLMVRAAVALSRETILLFSTKVGVFATRWSYHDYIRSLSEACATAISVHVGHSMFAGDAAVHRLNLFGGPSYIDRAESATVKIAAEIDRLAHRMIGNPRSPLFTDAEVLFSSDSPACMSHALLGVLCRASYRLYLTGEVSYRVSAALTGQTILPAVRGLTTEEDRCLALDRVTPLLEEWCRIRGLPIGEGQFGLIARGRMISSIPAGAAECLRGIRHSLLSRHPTRVAFRLRVSRAFDAPIVGLSRPLLSAVRSEPTVSDTVRALTTFSRYRGRVFGADYPSVYEWDRARAAFRERNVVIIGSGNGVAAAVASVSGATSVLGLDLRATFPTRALTSPFIPPAVRLFGNPLLYHQMEESYTTSGDWTDTEVASKVIDGIASDSLLVIDIQGTMYDNSLSLVMLAHAAGWRGECLIRIAGPRSYTRQVVGDAIISKMMPTCVVIHDGELFEVLALKVSLKTISLRMADTADVKISSGVPSDMSLYPGDRNYVVRSLTLGTSIETRNSLRDLYREAKERVIGMIGEYDARPTYSSWTRDIGLLYGLQLALLSDHEREDEIMRFVVEKRGRIALDRGHIWVSASRETIKLITRGISRLL